MPAAVTPRRFPPPWTIEEHNDACFIVHDKNGQALAYFYFEEEAGRRSAANLLTKDEARRMAVTDAAPARMARRLRFSGDMVALHRLLKRRRAESKFCDSGVTRFALIRCPPRRRLGSPGAVGQSTASGRLDLPIWPYGVKVAPTRTTSGISEGNAK